MGVGVEYKIFISWSGEPSRVIANFLKQWLEEVVDNLRVWVSDTDIAAGTRSMQEIEASLIESRMGIIITTRSNMGKGWINFEAGALSKVVGPTSGRVVPLLVDFEAMTDLVGPLSLFQALMLTKSDMAKLLRTVYEVIGSEDKSASKIERYWGDIEAEIPSWRAATQATSEAPDRPRRTEDVITEILGIVRELRDSRDAGVGGLQAPRGESIIDRQLERSSMRAALHQTFEILRERYGNSFMGFEATSQPSAPISVIVDAGADHSKIASILGTATMELAMRFPGVQVAPVLQARPVSWNLDPEGEESPSV
jgi:hypothetical protein